MLGVLSYLHLQANCSKPGHEIAALLAWDVEDVEKTPEFVIDCNRNFEKQGNIFHAEMVTIEAAFNHKRGARTESTEHYYREITKRLRNTTLYSSLEPCPFCIMGISWAGVPKVIYCINDPAMKDEKTNRPLITFPEEFCYRKKITRLSTSSLPLAIKENEALQEALLGRSAKKYEKVLADGRKEFDFYTYFMEKKDALFQSGYEQFSSYEVQYEENRQLYGNLKQKIFGIQRPQ
jgi:tRNA(Arg) A34 adenosine deaminase TadA